MIVTCSRCQARFRVADEKVGPRGAKVRCSRCQNVFAVYPPAVEPAPGPAAAPAAARPPVPFDLDLTPGIARLRPDLQAALPAPAPDPFAPAPGAPDPFAAAGLDALSAEVGQGDDPFRRAAGLAPSRPVPDDPFAPSPATLAPAPDLAVDPFALAGLDDPLAAPAPTASGGSLPVTDLAQLLGAPEPAAAPPPPAPRPAPVPPAAPPAVSLVEPARPVRQPAPVVPERLAEPPPEEVGLALEERSDPPPVAFADPDDVFGAIDALPSDPGEAALAGPIPFAADDGPLALATESTPGPERLDVAPEPSPRTPAPRAAVAVPAEGGAPAEDGAQLPGDEAEPPRRAPAAPERRLRTVAVNALSLVALLAIAVGFRAAWRGDAGVGAGLLGLSGVIGAPPRGTDGPYRVSDARAGTYELASGEAVVFVRGDVEAGPGSPGAPVRVQVDLVRDGQVLGRAEGLAGAVPTPEEVYASGGEEGRAALAAALQKRAARAAPGVRLPFLVIVGEAPAELAGAVVRVRAAAAQEAAP